MRPVGLRATWRDKPRRENFSPAQTFRAQSRKVVTREHVKRSELMLLTRTPKSPGRLTSRGVIYRRTLDDVWTQYAPARARSGRIS